MHLLENHKRWTFDIQMRFLRRFIMPFFFNIRRFVDLGMCEAVWEPDMEPDDLFESISQALLNAQDRDCLAGWGAVVHIM